MKKIKYLMPLFLALGLLCSCKTADGKELLNEALTKTNEASSYTIDYQINATFTEADDTFSMLSNGNVKLANKEFIANYSINMDDLGNNISSTSYYTDNTLYTFSNDILVSSEEFSYDEAIGKFNNLNEIINIISSTKVKKDGDNTLIIASIDKEKYSDVLLMSLNEANSLLGNNEEITEVVKELIDNITVDNLEYVINSEGYISEMKLEISVDAIPENGSMNLIVNTYFRDFDNTTVDMSSMPDTNPESNSWIDLQVEEGINISIRPIVNTDNLVEKVEFKCEVSAEGYDDISEEDLKQFMSTYLDDKYIDIKRDDNNNYLVSGEFPVSELFGDDIDISVQDFYYVISSLSSYLN